MTRPRYPFHLQSRYGKSVSACGNVGAVTLSRRSIKRVDCLNCLKIIERNVETKYYKPREVIK